MDLTERQTMILKAIIEEYIETAQPVGSLILEKKHGLGVSPATIRNEMALLVEKDFLRQPYASAGRVPTAKAFKYYVYNLMRKEELPVVDEVAVKEKVAAVGLPEKEVFTEATRELARRAHALAVLGTEERQFYHAGEANILDIPEFFNIDVTKTVLSMLDEFDYWLKLFEPGWETKEPYRIVLGAELGGEYLGPVGFVYSPFVFRGARGGVGVVGPARFNYRRIIPMVEYVGGLLEEIGKEF